MIGIPLVYFKMVRQVSRGNTGRLGSDFIKATISWAFLFLSQWRIQQLVVGDGSPFPFRLFPAFPTLSFPVAKRPL